MSESSSNDADNPYAPPAMEAELIDGDIAEALENRRVRAARYRAEASLKQSSLCLSAVFIMLGAAGFVSLATAGQRQSGWAVGLAAALAFCAIASLVVHWGVCRLAPWTRIPLSLLCLAGLPLVPLGTLFAAHILLILYWYRRPALLTRQYEQVVARTRHITEPTSSFSWVVLIFLLLIAVMVFFLVRLPWESGKSH